MYEHCREIFIHDNYILVDYYFAFKILEKILMYIQAVKMDSFYSSVKSRLLVAEVFARIQVNFILNCL